MSLGLARKKELQKRRAARMWAMIKLVLFIAVISGVGYLSFDTGQEIAAQNFHFLQSKHDQVLAENEDLRKQLGTTTAMLQQLQDLIPDQDVRDLLEVVNQKSADGVDVARMARLIGGLTAKQSCGTQSKAKRFRIGTIVSPADASSISFERGLITINGSGSPTLNEDGNPEAWYDPTKPVTVTFTLPGGESQDASGVLPIFHSLVLGDKEYRFSIIEGRRSFADVSLLVCDVK
tara:strand:- start:9097 stop:9798 length:702 start_codon:yes stop_codon:yes gene_type:complete